MIPLITTSRETDGTGGLRRHPTTDVRDLNTILPVPTYVTSRVRKCLLLHLPISHPPNGSVAPPSLSTTPRPDRRLLNEGPSWETSVVHHGVETKTS